MKKIAIAVFILTIISIPLSFTISCVVGEVDIFGSSGFLRYTWISLLFIPIGILSLCLFFIFNKQNKGYKFNLVSGLICIPVLLFMGFFPTEMVDFDKMEEVRIVENKIDMSLPDKMKTVTEYFDDCTITRAKILSEKEKKDLDHFVMYDGKWTSKLNSLIKNSLPEYLQYEIFSDFEYFLFYNETLAEYNSYPTMEGEFKCVFIAYDTSVGKMMIINEYLLLNK